MDGLKELVNYGAAGAVAAVLLSLFVILMNRQSKREAEDDKQAREDRLADRSALVKLVETTAATNQRMIDVVESNTQALRDLEKKLAEIAKDRRSDARAARKRGLNAS